MIHYTCDRCRKIIDPQHESRYEVCIEINSIDESNLENNGEASDDRDHLLEIHNALEKELAEIEHDPYADAPHSGPDRDHMTLHEGVNGGSGSTDESAELFSDRDHRFDLCSECFSEYAKSPVGRDVQVQLGFSQN